MNDPDEHIGVGPSPVNIVDHARWNTAFAYLDPVRTRGNLTIIGDALVDRVELHNDRAVAVHAIVNGKPARIAAERIILAAGAYGSPAILLRSGIGPAAELRSLNITTAHDLPGVGRSLADHPAVNIIYRPSTKLDRSMAEFAQSHWSPDEQSLAKARSSICKEAFDIHIYAVAGWRLPSGNDVYAVAVSPVWPKSTGAITLTSPDPTATLRIDHNYLSDPDGEDLRVLLDGFEIARDIMSTPVMNGTIENESQPGSAISSPEELAAHIERKVGIYYHPACSCRMGPESDSNSVVNHKAKVHGIEDLYICDASIFPTLMRANTNLPAAMLAEHLADSIAKT